MFDLGVPVGAASISPLLYDVAIPIAALVVYLSTSGRYTTRVPVSNSIPTVLIGGLFASMVEIAYGVAAGSPSQRALPVTAILLGSLVALACGQAVMGALYRFNVFVVRVVAIGDAIETEEVRSALLAVRSLGYRIVASLEASDLIRDTNQPVLTPLLRKHQAQSLLIASVPGPDQRAIVDKALHEQVPFVALEQIGFNFDAVRLFGHGVVLFARSNGLSRRALRFSKAAAEVSVALLLLLLLGPLLIGIGLLVAVDGGPIFFSQMRLGQGGRPFRCLKFRTMVTDADVVLRQVLNADPIMAAEWRATQKLRNDPRVTRVGRFLRSTSLDELPQLLNVVRLEMSLVGPRPIVADEVAFYGPSIAEYFAVRPGLTGLWQVSGRSDTSYPQRVRLDTWYVRNWTIWCDIAVLLRTIPAVIRRQGAR